MAQPRAGSVEVDQAQPYTPYGKACLNCVKSKTRCASSTIKEKCERCYRMKKDCQPARAVRQKRVSKGSTSTAIKTAVLEEKLEGIVQILQRSQVLTPGPRQQEGQIPNQGIDLRACNCRPSSSSGLRDANQISRGGENGTANIGSWNFLAADDPSLISGERLDENGLTNSSKLGWDGLIRGPVNQPSPPASLSAGYSTVPQRLGTSNDYPLESEAELEEYLETYRTKMVPYFPIVCISPNVMVGELKKERPFLFLVIRAICSKNLDRQAALVRDVKKVLGREMLLEGTKTLDLLLGILAFTAWCHLYICIKPVNSTIVQLGLSLAFELGLTRPPPAEPVRVLLNYTAQGCPKPTNDMNLERTMEERRASVGLYLISSVFANYFQRIEFMRWTRYLDECLRLLEEKKEYPTDEVLVYLVRVQLICNKGSALTWNHVLGDTELGAPTDLYVKTLKSQLDSLECSIPQTLKSNVTLQLHILNTALTIHEHSLSTASKSSFSDPTAQLQRIESLWICFTAVKSWFNIFFNREAIPLSCYGHFSMAILTQMAHCLAALFRLSTFEAPDIPWDRQRIRREMDLGDIVKLIVDSWEQVPQAAGIEIPHQPAGERGDNQMLEGSWLYGMKGLLVVRSFWEAKVAAMAAADAEREGGPGPEDNRAMNEFGIPGSQQMDALEFGAMNMDMLDDTWLRDGLGGYDFNL
ncbi:hypothetical protein OIDMADRAFT_150163 [Oidiodendron maius Zn]|uniref:Zn(2)-C6 fungal-type domain-containing protein n=1 Tax=Oidiodendron maius (strain Zn) TaxID=913774 RepID=A0A0C3HXG2_OIDMZ|nr:hypothetical protein OIDMADRAFT_150163 [Oidiodendron maius Zn]